MGLALLDVWLELHAGGAGFWLLLGGALAALFSVLAYPFVRRPYLPLLASAVSVAGGVMLVERGRKLVIDAVLHPVVDPEAKVSSLASGVSLQMNALAAIGVVVANTLLLAGVVMGVAWALRRRRENKAIFVGLTTAYALGGLAMLSVQGLLVWALAAIHAFAGVAGVDPSMKVPLIRLSFVESGEKIVEARSLLLYAGGVALAAMVLRAVRAARRGEVVANGAVGVSLGLFAVGAGAFVITRARAADAAQPLSAESQNLLDLPNAPRVESCGKSAVSVEPAPVLMVGDELKLDGRKLANLSDASDDLVTLWNNHKLLHPGDDSTQPVLLLAAEAKQPVAPFLEKWRALKSQYELHLVAVVPQPVQTRTVGRLERFMTCAWVVRFGKGLKAPATFAELAAAMAESDRPFAVELP